MKTSDLKIEKLTRKTKPFKKRLEKNLRAYNESKVGPPNVKELSLRVLSKNKKLAAGLLGFFYWNGFFIDGLWVDGRLRGRGLGRRLLERAEMEARRRKSEIIHLVTTNFQAPGFYRKMGYSVYGKLRGLPRGQTAYYFYKKL